MKRRWEMHSWQRETGALEVVDRVEIAKAYAGEAHASHAQPSLQGMDGEIPCINRPGRCCAQCVPAPQRDQRLRAIIVLGERAAGRCCELQAWQQAFVDAD